MLKELRGIYTIHPWLRYTTWFGLMCLAISLLWLSGDFSHIGSFPAQAWLTLIHAITAQEWQKQGARGLLFFLSQAILLFLWFFAWLLLCWVCLSFIRSSIAKIPRDRQNADNVGARFIAPSAPSVVTDDHLNVTTTPASQRATDDFHERSTMQNQAQQPAPTIQPALSTHPTQSPPASHHRQFTTPQRAQASVIPATPTRHTLRASQLLPLTWQRQQDLQDEDNTQGRLHEPHEQNNTSQKLMASPARVPQGYVAVQDIPTYPGNRHTRHTDTHLSHPIHSYTGITTRIKPRSALHFDIGVGWDAGLTRKRSPNEDSLAVLQGICTYQTRLVPFGIFIVADGMGGHAFGQEASRIATQSMMQTVVHKITHSENTHDDRLIELLIEGVGLANQHICTRSEERGREMGTTITAVLVVEQRAYIVNVGDSRTYLYRQDDGLSQITRDHSLVAHLVTNGLITPDAAYTHPERNKVYRSVGNPAGVEVDWFTVDLHAEDHLLLCSDGLWEMVRDHHIEHILRRQNDSTTMSNELVAAALHGGGTDNISVIVVGVG